MIVYDNMLEKVKIDCKEKIDPLKIAAVEILFFVLVIICIAPQLRYFYHEEEERVYISIIFLIKGKSVFIPFE